MFDLSVIAPESPCPLFRAECDRLVELGLFAGERLELLRGVIVRKTPQRPAHAYTIRMLNRRLNVFAAARTANAA